MNVLIGKMVQEGLIDESAARGISGLLASGEHPARAFAACGLAEEPLIRFWTREFGYPYIELEQRSFSKDFLAQFPARVLLDKHVMPVEGADSEVFVVTSNQFDTSAIDQLRLATGMDFQMAMAPLADIERCIKRYLAVGADTVQSMISEAGENGLQVIDTESDDDMHQTNLGKMVC